MSMMEEEEEGRASEKDGRATRADRPLCVCVSLRLCTG